MEGGYIEIERDGRTIQKPMAHIRLAKFREEYPKGSIRQSIVDVNGKYFAKTEVWDIELPLAITSYRISNIDDEAGVSMRLTFCLSKALALLGYDIDFGIAGGEEENENRPKTNKDKKIKSQTEALKDKI